MCMKSCGTTVEGALRSVPGCEVARVVYGLRLACAWGTADSAALIDAVEAVGFGATICSEMSLQLEPAVTLRVTGMMCQKSCAATAQKALCSLDRAIDATVDYPTETARVFGAVYPQECIDALACVGFDAAVADAADATDAAAAAPQHGAPPAVERNGKSGGAKAGGDARGDAGGGAGGNAENGDGDGDGRIMLNVGGMSCASCVNKVESALLSVPGAASASVSLPLGQASVACGPGVPRVQLEAQLVAKVASLGFSCSRSSLSSVAAAGADGPSGSERWRALEDLAARGSQSEELSRCGRRLCLAASCTVPLMLVQWGVLPIRGGGACAAGGAEAARVRPRRQVEHH